MEGDKREPYLIQFYIEEPSGDTYRAEAMSNTRVGDIATDFFEERNWPTRDASGQPVRAMVERVPSDHPGCTEWLCVDHTLEEANVHDGDTLRMKGVTMHPSSSKAKKWEPILLNAKKLGDGARSESSVPGVFILLPRFVFSPEINYGNMPDYIHEGYRNMHKSLFQAVSQVGFNPLFDDGSTRGIKSAYSSLLANIIGSKVVVIDITDADPYVMDALVFSLVLHERIIVLLHGTYKDLPTPLDEDYSVVFDFRFQDTQQISDILLEKLGKVVSVTTKDTQKTKEEILRGQQRMEGEEKRPVAFIILPRAMFSEEARGGIPQEIVEAVETAGYEPLLDNPARPGAGNIATNLVRDIVKSQVVLVDLTGFDPYVIHALGSAMAIRERVLLLFQGEDRDLPSSLRGEYCISYRDNAAGLRDLRRTLREALQRAATGQQETGSNTIYSALPEYMRAALSSPDELTSFSSLKDILRKLEEFLREITRLEGGR
jgi:hypothetical protein